DGDGVSVVDANNDGVPDKPAANLLRFRTTTSFDDRGREYRSQVFSVDPTSGAVSSGSLATDTWRDHRGNVIKKSEPGGLVGKTQVDGAGRKVKTFTTDGGGDATWADAGNVAGDAVLGQTETQYDADGTPILVIRKDRFRDETATGELGNATTAPRARASYSAGYFDAANRRTDSVAVGTNGGTAWTRPATPPARSDTVLVTTTAYNDAGWVDTVTDPRGVVTKTYYDALARKTKTIEAYTDGTPTDTSNKTAERTFDGAGNVLTVKLVLP